MDINVARAPNLSNQTPWKAGVTLGAALFIIIIMALAGMLIPLSIRPVIWIVTLVLLALLLGVISRGVTGRWSGLLIDERKKISLSRFQTILWGILILSAFLAAALTNLRIDMFNNPIDAVSISIPVELLALLGISATSSIGAPLILNVKSRQQHIDTNASIDQASWYDMFRGDDTANADYLDLSKVQMFYVTVILILVYGAALAVMFRGVEGGAKGLVIVAFPPLSSTLVTLLGISHTAYLVYKAIPRGQPMDQSGANAGVQSGSAQVP